MSWVAAVAFVLLTAPAGSLPIGLQEAILSEPPSADQIAAELSKAGVHAVRVGQEVCLPTTGFCGVTAYSQPAPVLPGLCAVRVTQFEGRQTLVAGKVQLQLFNPRSWDAYRYVGEEAEPVTAEACADMDRLGRFVEASSPQLMQEASSLLEQASRAAHKPGPLPFAATCYFEWNRTCDPVPILKSIDPLNDIVAVDPVCEDRADPEHLPGCRQLKVRTNEGWWIVAVNGRDRVASVSLWSVPPPPPA